MSAATAQSAPLDGGSDLTGAEAFYLANYHRIMTHLLSSTYLCISFGVKKMCVQVFPVFFFLTFL